MNIRYRYAYLFCGRMNRNTTGISQQQDTATGFRLLLECLGRCLPIESRTRPERERDRAGVASILLFPTSTIFISLAPLHTRGYERDERCVRLVREVTFTRTVLFMADHDSVLDVRVHL